MPRPLASATLFLALTLIPRGAPGQQTPPQVPGTVRTGITMVPIDVRVLDRNGQPVTDLRQQDFTVLENGVVQQIRHFSASTLTPGGPRPGAGPTFRSAAASAGSAPARRNQRVFLIVLGRGDEVEVNLPEGAEKHAMRHVVRVAVSARRRYFKAIVYDPVGDTLGSTVTRLK
jgi:hypothetical protein